MVTILTLRSRSCHLNSQAAVLIPQITNKAWPFLGTLLWSPYLVSLLPSLYSCSALFQAVAGNFVSGSDNILETDNTGVWRHHNCTLYIIKWQCSEPELEEFPDSGRLEISGLLCGYLCWQLQIQRAQRTSFFRLPLHKNYWASGSTVHVQTNTIFLNEWRLPEWRGSSGHRRRDAPPPVPRPRHQMSLTTGLTPRVWCLWWMLRCLILYPWSQSDTNKITGWMGAPDTVIRPWDRDPQGLSGLYLDLNFLKTIQYTCNNDKQCIDWGDLVAPNQPWCYCSRCTAVLHCTAGAVITPWRLCVGAALSNNTHSQLTPWDRSHWIIMDGDTNGWDFSPPIIFGSHSVMLYCVMTMSCYEMWLQQCQS